MLMKTLNRSVWALSKHMTWKVQKLLVPRRLLTALVLSEQKIAMASQKDMFDETLQANEAEGEPEELE